MRYLLAILLVLCAVPSFAGTATLNVAEACQRAGVSNLIELMIKESGE